MAELQSEKKTEKETLQNAADALLQQAFPFKVDITPANKLHQLMQAWGWLPKKRSFEIRPLVLGSLIRISKLLLSFDNSLLTKDVLFDKDRTRLLNVNYELMERHSEDMAKIIAIAVTNEKAEPMQSLVDFFLFNLTPQEMLQVFKVIIMQMDVAGFTASIISTRGLSVLESKDASAKDAEMNPETQGS